MKKGLKIFLIILSVIVLIPLSVITVNVIREKGVLEEVEETEVTKFPSIDFVQPWLIKDFSDSDYDTYFSKLSDIGYDTLILQYTRTEESDLTSTFYYPTSISQDVVSHPDNSSENVLTDLLRECKEHNFKLWVGLSVEEYSWWALTCYYDSSYMNHCADVDSTMVNEISAIVNTDEYKDTFAGWYFAYELFSNPVGWENLWAKNFNKVKDTIVALNDGKPIMFSPFRQIILGNVTDEYLMWMNFFKKTNFRECDIFCPQDSIGKLDTTLDNSEDVSSSNYRKIADYITACYRACKDSNVKFYVNCELFRTPDESLHLYVSDMERTIWQLKNVNRVISSDALIVTFSASHYMVDSIDGACETAANRLAFYNAYKEFYLENK